MKKLITMTEYVWGQCTLWNDGKMNNHKFVCRISNYAQLLHTPLELGQFIPCKDGEPMEEPERKEYCIQGVEMSISKEYKAYLEALDSVLFEGWEYENGKLNTDGRYNLDFRKMPEGRFFFIAPDLEKLKTIEDLINSGIELVPTDTCKKPIIA